MRRAALVAGILVVAALAGRSLLPHGEFQLPARIRIDELVASFTTAGRDAVLKEAANDPVRTGTLQPGHVHEVQGGPRRALVVAPPSTLRFRTRLPDRARLQLGLAVAGDGRRDDEAAGVHFAVEIDGREIFARTVNPAARRDDRRWFDADLPLDGGGREVEIMLRTERDGRGARLAGTPGWSDVRIVSEASRDRQAASPTAPSVLVLMVDTLRADQLGCYGATPGPTPAADRLAREGMLFEEMVSASSWTMPAVATYLTGLYPRSHGVQGRALEQPEGSDDDAEDPAFLPDAIPTLPELAQRAGITTVGVAANPLIARATNFTRGFETFVEGGWERERKNWMPAARLNATFVRWLRQNRGRRFLAYLHYMDPHDPYTPADDPPRPAGVSDEIAAGQVERVARAILQRGRAPLAPAEVAHLRRLYGLEVRDWDIALAALLAALDAEGVRESTAIVLVADHGEEFQEHGQMKHRIHLYDELVRVPFVVAAPGVTAGRTRDQVLGVDVFPTVAALLGVDVPAGLPGRNVLAAREPRPAFSETRYGVLPDGRRAALLSVRSGGWKLITAPALGHAELYDLARDPGETDDRFGRAPEGTKLAGLLAAWESSAPAPPPVTGHDPALQQKLRALGYVE